MESILVDSLAQIHITAFMDEKTGALRVNFLAVTNRLETQGLYLKNLVLGSSSRSWVSLFLGFCRIVKVKCPTHMGGWNKFNLSIVLHPRLGL